MRLCLLPATLSLSFLIGVATAADQPREDPTLAGLNLLARPDAYRTLVNPNCSHCIDEAKRRATELRHDDRVMAWTRGKHQGGAVPVRFFLVPYRVISDTYGVFVYDHEAGFVRGFEPSLDFTFYGWRNGVMVIRHKDGTLFSALSGRAFAGPRQGEQLKPIATLDTDWGYWANAYPGSVAYQMFEKYQPIEVPKTEYAESVRTRSPADPRLAASSSVLGISLGGKARAYPISALEKSPGVLADTIDGKSVIVLWYAASRTAAIYSTDIDETSPPQRATLAFDAETLSAPFVDKETGSHWGIEGRAVAGPLKGKTLGWLPSVQCRWFAWTAEYPASEIYTSESAARSDRLRQTAPATQTGENSQRCQKTATACPEPCSRPVNGPRG